MLTTLRKNISVRQKVNHLSSVMLLQKYKFLKISSLASITDFLSDLV